jgi:hypothetical protein
MLMPPPATRLVAGLCISKYTSIKAIPSLNPECGNLSCVHQYDGHAATLALVDRVTVLYHLCSVAAHILGDQHIG